MLHLSACSLFIPENDSTPAQIVWTHLHSYLVARQNTDVMHPHFTGNGSQNFMAVFQPHTEHCVTECFYNNSILFN